MWRCGGTPTAARRSVSGVEDLPSAGHPAVAMALGLADNRNSTIDSLPTFGQTKYFAPYIPKYTTGGPFPPYANDPFEVRKLKNFVFK